MGRLPQTLTFLKFQKMNRAARSVHMSQTVVGTFLKKSMNSKPRVVLKLRATVFFSVPRQIIHKCSTGINDSLGGPPPSVLLLCSTRSGAARRLQLDVGALVRLCAGNCVAIELCGRFHGFRLTEHCVASFTHQPARPTAQLFPAHPFPHRCAMVLQRHKRLTAEFVGTLPFARGAISIIILDFSL